MYVLKPSQLRSLGMPAQIKPLYLFDNDQGIKQHPSYLEAKAGSTSHAIELIGDLALETIYKHRDRFGRDCVFVAPHAKEVTGDNAIPQVLAEVSSLVCGAIADQEIVQTTKVYHTGADPMERLISRPEFQGRVDQGRSYVLVDDVTSLGGTLAELAHCIQTHGGKVKDVFILVNAGRNKSLQPEQRTLKLLEARFGHDIVKTFGIAVGALTANEAQYLVGFRSVDEIRNRVAKARQEIDLRLRSKGVRRDPSAQIGPA